MGITVDLRRCRIGCFSQKHTRLSKSTGGKIHLSMFQSSISLSLRIALFTLLIVQGIECNSGPTQGEKGGKLSTIPDRSTRSRTGSNIAARGEERRNSITRIVSTSEHRALNVSTPSTLSPVRQNSDQPSINVDFNHQNSISRVLGFTGAKYTEGFHESENVVDILRINSILVNIDIISGSYVNGTTKSTIYSFFPKVSPGYKIIESPVNLVYLPITLDTIDSLNVTITDQNYHLLNLRNEKITIRFHIREAR